MLRIPVTRILALLLLPSLVFAEALDEGVSGDALLLALVNRLDVLGVDVTRNLNDRDFARRIDRPRLGRFPDLPVRRYPGTTTINAWEQGYIDGEIVALALLPAHRGENDRSADAFLDGFLDDWLGAGLQSPALITAAANDRAILESLQQVLQDLHYRVLPLYSPESAPVTLAGELFATAAQRLALDSRQARRVDSDVPEFAYLGERLRRNSDSLFPDDGNRGDRSLARAEPAVFEKETLGDEFSESTIREIIVPGGVALGETAYLADEMAELRFVDGALLLIDTAGQSWALPVLPTQHLKALFDFTQRSQDIRSDAIVDIDADGRVSISSALRDTDVGYDIMHADTLPFQYIDYLRVTKSVMIDTGVDWFADIDQSKALTFASNFEVRFLSADNMRIAQTRVALEYEYEADAKTVVYIDNWGEDGDRLRENSDLNGLGSSVAKIAEYAGWIGLFRHVLEAELQFTRGRYAFMKIDKLGRETPYRY